MRMILFTSLAKDNSETEMRMCDAMQMYAKDGLRDLATACNCTYFVGMEHDLAPAIQNSTKPIPEPPQFSNFRGYLG
jgi:hypothetical protein